MATKPTAITFWMITHEQDNFKKFNTKCILTDPAKHTQTSEHSSEIYSDVTGKRRLLWRSSL